ncbi:GNAT family N-acetyltransferase [Agrobacterium tumefaciens]|nr:GNAT family N-acetyltransferase [Agrobacterium tumefaciens]
MNFSLDVASPADASVFQNLMQLYTHDFSQFWAGTPRGELEQNGRFPDYPLDAYFDRPHWSAFLLKADERPVGFALINDASHSTLPADYSVAEFFIVRKYRGQGFGLIAAQRLFQQHPGAWEVAVARKNVAALRFWQGAIRKSAVENSMSELDWDRPEWNGAIIRFHVAA